MHRLPILVFVSALAASPALAEPTFSVDFQGPLAGTPVPDSFFAVPLTEGDILTTGVPGPPGPNPPAPGPLLPPPGIEVGAAPGAIGVVPGGLGIVPGLGGRVELDALSYGRDQGPRLFFSVDEFAAGVPGGVPPNVFSEGSVGTLEASADVFRFRGLFLGPLPPGPLVGNAAHLDGDGAPPTGLPGFGLIEPNIPSPGVLLDVGDNLDALDLDTTLADLAGPIFFSVDSAFPDPLEPPPANSGTSVGLGVSGADVLLTFAGAAPVVAIPAGVLGLDLLGFDTDDLDALIFNDADGSLSLTPGDTIHFSVRRGSAVIGAPDSAFGVPIEEADILTLPTAVGLPPALSVAGEVMRLATARSGTIGPFGPDDLDALDILPLEPVPAAGFGAQLALAALMLAAVWIGRRRLRS